MLLAGCFIIAACSSQGSPSLPANTQNAPQSVARTNQALPDIVATPAARPPSLRPLTIGEDCDDSNSADVCVGGNGGGDGGYDIGGGDGGGSDTGCNGERQTLRKPREGRSILACDSGGGSPTPTPKPKPTATPSNYAQKIYQAAEAFKGRAREGSTVRRLAMSAWLR